MFAIGMWKERKKQKRLGLHRSLMVATQLAGRSPPIPEVRRSYPIIDNFSWNIYLLSTRRKENKIWPGIVHFWTGWLANIFAQQNIVCLIESLPMYDTINVKPSCMLICMEVIIARLDHNGEHRWSNWPRYVGIWLLLHPPRLLRQGRFKPCLRPGYFLLRLIRLHNGDLNAVGCGEGPWVLVTPVPKRH